MTSISQPYPFLPNDEPEAGLPVTEGMVIDLGEAEPGGMAFVEGEGGLLEQIMGEDAKEAAPESGHYENLAEGMDESTLSAIATQITEWVEGDIDSRKGWHDRLADGVKAIGVINDNETDPKSDNPFELVKNITHPLISGACVQFQARAIAELVPPGGPVKAMVLGERSKEAEEQSQRVADYMNYDLMVKNQDYFPETDAMLFVLALEGSQFKKTYYDTLTGQNISQHIRPENFIVPYGAVSLKSAPRYTHQISISANDMKKLQAKGFYRQCDLVSPTDGGTFNDKIKETRDRAQGQEQSVVMTDDADHTAWECTCDYEIPGFEDPDGIGRPYVITVEKESMKVLSIYRNWEEDDEDKSKIVSFVHYPFIPADGFYSYGFLHLIGGLGKAATGMLKTILMGAAYSAMRGGFKSKDAKVPGDVKMSFGKYIDVDMTSDELQKAFYEPNFAGPGQPLFDILNLVVEAGQVFSSTTENMVGDANNNGPVGTTVALIEQGSKVFSGNHKRLHYAQGIEFQQLARLHGIYLPEEGYPYKIHGADKQIFRKDFDDRIDVVPVSDPNIFSSTQRIAIAQSVRQMAMEQPQLFNQKVATQRMLDAMRVPDPEELMIDREQIKRRDPISENMCMMNGIPVRVFQDQDHDAHYAVCQTEIQRIEAEKNPAMMQLLPAFYAHLAEHTAYAMRARYSQAMGMVLPPVDLNKEAEPDEEDPGIDPALDNQISIMAAQAIARMPKPPAQGSPEMQQQAEQLQQQAKELEAKDKELQQKQAAIDAELKTIDQAKVEIDRMKAELKSTQREGSLQSTIEKLQLDVKRLNDNQTQQRHDKDTHDIIGAAVENVQGALDKKTQGDRDERHKRELEDASRGGED